MLLRKSEPATVSLAGHGAQIPFPFIVGVPRSGTSLLTQMLHSHPELAIPMETRFFPDVADCCRAAEDPRDAFLEFIHSHQRWASFQIDDRVFRDRVARLEPFDIGEALRLVYSMYAGRMGKSRWGDKSPSHVDAMTMIQEVLPEAHFIHLIRDGRDVALSVKDLWFGPSTIEDAATWWSLHLWRARGQVENLHHYYEVRYEDLVLSPEETLRQLCDFVDLRWDPAMLNYPEKHKERIAEADLTRPADARERQKTENRPHFNELIGKPPQTDRVAVWRREMAPEDQRQFDDIAGDLLEAYGYPLAAVAGES